MDEPNQDPKRNPTLEDAWGLYARYTLSAEVLQRRTRRLRAGLLAAGTAAAALAILNASLLPDSGGLLRFSVLLLSLVAAGLAAAFLAAPGADRAALRAAAGAVEREIYTFRSQVGVYGAVVPAQDRREARLARRLKAIEARLEKSAGRFPERPGIPAQLPPSLPAGDDGFSSLWADEYAAYRLENQLARFKAEAARLDKRLRGLRAAAAGFAVLGVLLAAAGLEMWVAVAVPLLIAAGGLIDADRLEERRARRRLVVSDLEAARLWWRTLSPGQRHLQENVERLIALTESALAAQALPWSGSLPEGLQAPGAPDADIFDSEDWGTALAGDAVGARLELSDEDLADLDRLVTSELDPGVVAAHPARPPAEPRPDRLTTSELDPDVVEAFQKGMRHEQPKYATRDLDPAVVEAYQNLSDPAAENQDILDEIEREEKEPPKFPAEEAGLPFGEVDFEDEDVEVADFIARDYRRDDASGSSEV